MSEQFFSKQKMFGKKDSMQVKMLSNEQKYQEGQVQNWSTKTQKSEINWVVFFFLWLVRVHIEVCMTKFFPLNYIIFQRYAWRKTK
jgi:hypothetical protein